VRLFVNTYPEYKIVNLDALTYAGNLENLKDIEEAPNYIFEKADILDANELDRIFSKHMPMVLFTLRRNRMWTVLFYRRWILCTPM
jgi:dTDP-D-glucose 4,6-dehydratase